MKRQSNGRTNREEQELIWTETIKCKESKERNIPKKKQQPRERDNQKINITETNREKKNKTKKKYNTRHPIKSLIQNP